MLDFVRTRVKSFRYALSGWWYVIHTQKNAWIHAVASSTVIFVAFWLGLNRQDFAILLLTIGFVWTAEFINTALEAVVDLASPSHHPLAKVGKDVGAAAVLIAALVAALVGLLVLGPPLFARLSSLFA